MIRFHQVIAERIRACAALIPVMTPATEASKWVNNEVKYAQDHQKPVLPLLLRGKPLISVTTLDYEDVRGERMPGVALVERLKALVGTGVHTTPPPVLTPPPPAPTQQAIDYSVHLAKNDPRSYGEPLPYSEISDLDASSEYQRGPSDVGDDSDEASEVMRAPSANQILWVILAMTVLLCAGLLWLGNNALPAWPKLW